MFYGFSTVHWQCEMNLTKNSFDRIFYLILLLRHPINSVIKRSFLKVGIAWSTKGTKVTRRTQSYLYSDIVHFVYFVHQNCPQQSPQFKLKIGRASCRERV